MKTLDLIANRLPSVMLFIGILALWWLVVTLFAIPEYLLPSPGAVFAASFSGEIPWFTHGAVTSIEIIGGFLVSAAVGVLLGVLIAWSPILERALIPFLVFVNTLPKVAIAPLFLLWFGYGIIPNMMIAALIGFFPVVINTAVGLSLTPREMIDLGRIFGASDWRMFLRIRIPGALPYILSALKVSASTCVIGAIVAEFIASQRGLGYVIINAQTTLNTPTAFAAILWISVIGLLTYAAVSLLGKWLAPWAQGDHPQGAAH